MNNQKPFLIGGSILLGVIALSLVFMAGRMTGSEGRFDWRNEGREMMGRNFERGGMMEGRNGRWGKMMDWAMQFIDESSLSGDQKTQLETLIKDQQTKMQDLIQTLRSWSGETTTGITAQIDVLWKEHMAALRPFVAADKLTEFDAFVAKGKPEMGGMFWNKGRGMW